MTVRRSTTPTEAPPGLSRKRRAFSLVELLVVVAIVSLLAAILAPGLQRAKRLARRAVCMSQVHQQLQIQLIYASAHGGWFPPSPRDPGIEGYRHEPQYVRQNGDNVNWWAVLRNRYLPDSKLLVCPLLAIDLAPTYYGEYFQNMAWDHGGNYGGWDSTATHVWIPYQWIAGFRYDPEPGEPEPAIRVSEGSARNVIITHRCTIASTADWDMTHGGSLFGPPGLQGFDRFTVTDQPLGYLDGGVGLHYRPQIQLRFTFAPYPQAHHY